MTLKTGDLEENGAAPSSDVKALTEMVLKLQNDLAAIKLGNTQVSPGSNVDLVKALAEFSAAQEKAKSIDFKGGIRVEDIPKDDYVEQGVRFCSPFTGYAIADDRRNGHYVLIPYNKEVIFFEYQGTREMQIGKHIQLMNFSTYNSQSKKEIEWLRGHTFFNTMFYESTKGVTSFDVQKAQKLSRIMTMLSNFEMPQVIARCKEYQIPINEDLSVMRSMLAMKMAERELESEQTTTQRRLVEIDKERALLQGKN